MPAKPGAMSNHAKQEVDACLLVTMPRSIHGLCVLQELAVGPVEPLDGALAVLTWSTY